jgi:hypothetical protein
MADPRSNQDNEQIDHFKKLPFDVLIEVFSRLPMTDVLRLNTVDKQFSAAANIRSLWATKLSILSPEDYQKIYNANINNLDAVDWYDHCKKLCDRQYKELWSRYSDDKTVRPLVGQIFAFKDNDLARFTIKENDPEPIKELKYREICNLANQPAIIKWIQKGRCSQEMLDVIFKAAEHLWKKQQDDTYAFEDVKEWNLKSYTLQDIKILCNQTINNENEYLEYLKVDINYFRQLDFAAKYNRPYCITFIMDHAKKDNLKKWDNRAQFQCLSSACEGGQLDIFKWVLGDDKEKFTTTDFIGRACISGSFDLVNFENYMCLVPSRYGVFNS